MENAKDAIIVTGATGGLGHAVSVFMAGEAKKSGACLVLSFRNPEKAEELKKKVLATGIEEGNLFLERLNLSDFLSIDSFVRRIAGYGFRVKTIVNNAGSMYKYYTVNHQGYEMNMLTNCIGPAVLSLKLSGYMEKGGSVINVLSLTRNYVDLNDSLWKGSQSTYSRLVNYSKSKAALTVFTSAMAESFPDLYVNGVDPGVMNTAMLKMDKWFDPLTNIFFRPFTYKPEKSLEAVKSAYINEGRNSGYIFSVKRKIPIEKKFSAHKLKTAIFAKIKELAWGAAD